MDENAKGKRQKAKIRIAHCMDHVGEEVFLQGWVQVLRVHGKIAFMDLRDGSGIIQVGAFTPELADIFAGFSVQDVVEIKGLVKKREERYINKKLPLGEIEIEAKEAKLITKSDEMPFDMAGKDLVLELPTLLDYRSLTLRHPKVFSIFKVQEVVVDSFRNYFKEKGFTEFQSPVIIPQAAEGGAEVFEVDYFGHKAFLSQSPQFYKQILVGVFGEVFSVNKTLRAEPSITTRHLAEVTTLDTEFGFISSWRDVLDVAEDAIKNICREVQEKCTHELELFEVLPLQIPDEIPRIKLREAQEIILERTKRDNRKEPDLTPEDEREIGRWAKEERGSDFIFITHYPVEKRPFYTFEDPEDVGYTLSADLLFRGVEIMTGGQRIHDLEILEENAKKRGIDIKKSELYFQAFKYALPPEGGFSFGSERIVMQLLNLQNIREASLFPRDMERVDARFAAIEKTNSKD